MNECNVVKIQNLFNFYCKWQYLIQQLLQLRKYLMSIKMGLRYGDDDDAAKIVPPPQSIKLDANRVKSKGEKNLDNLLFGGPVKKRQSKQPTKEQPKQKQEQPKIKVVQKTEPEVVIKPAVQPNPKRNSGESVQQPSQIKEQKNTDGVRFNVSSEVFNKPNYIRKLRKVAEDFHFKEENSSRHFNYEVLRPIQCERHYMTKLREPSFVDHQFPPNQRSLGPTHKDLNNVEWKRAGVSTKQVCFGKYIDPNDILPGTLSSPEVLSVMSCLAEKEANIKRLIEDQKFNHDGFYLVRVNVNGVWRYITVDDHIPTNGIHPLCASSYLDTETDIWVSMVQKAYAKVYLGTYDTFAKPVLHQNILRDLTGAPTRVYTFDNPDIQLIVKEALEKGGSALAVPNQSILKTGLNPNYCFNVLNSHVKGNMELRCSWGTIQQKTTLPLSKEGSFQFSLKQCKDFLSHIVIAKTQNDYYSSVIQSKHRYGFYCTYSFVLEDYAEGTISVNQIDERFFPSQQKYKYCPMRIIIEKKSFGSANYINGNYSTNTRNLDVDVNLVPGQYFIHVIGDWSEKHYDYFLSFYGSQKAEFKRIYSREFPNLIHQSLDKECIANGNSVRKGAINEYVLLHEPTNLIVITVENSDTKQCQFVQDLTRIKFDTLHLLSARSQGEHFKGMVKDQIDDYKTHIIQNRKWQAKLRGGETYSWVLMSTEPYNQGNLRKWGLV